MSKFHTIKTLDGVEVEVTHSDMGFPPGGSEGRQALNTTCVWVKPLGGEWIRSGRRSAMVTCDLVKHSNVAELEEKLK